MFDWISEFLGRRRDLAACSFCNQIWTKSNILIEGPDRVFICDTCVESQPNRVSHTGESSNPYAFSTTPLCSFCRDPSEKEFAHLSPGREHAICRRCLATSEQLLKEHRLNDDVRG